MLFQFGVLTFNCFVEAVLFGKTDILDLLKLFELIMLVLLGSLSFKTEMLYLL